MTTYYLLPTTYYLLHLKDIFFFAVKYMTRQFTVSGKPNLWTVRVYESPSHCVYQSLSQENPIGETSARMAPDWTNLSTSQEEIAPDTEWRLTCHLDSTHQAHAIPRA